ncbi:MAG: hypothetical protein GDA48_11880 [Hormoscilla sp. GM102CHS1]|nr:hypothetical protein [Hormoscilla sp. GM102CHS1]
MAYLHGFVNDFYWTDALEITSPSPVRVIILFTETAEDPDDESIESVKASLRRSLAEAKEGKRLPIDQLWEGIDAD